MDDLEVIDKNAGNPSSVEVESGDLEYVADSFSGAEDQHESVQLIKKEVIFNLERAAEKLEALVVGTPSLEAYLELSDIYLALGTLTKDQEKLRKAVDAADQVIKLKEKDRPIVDNAEQNRRAAYDRLGTGSYSYSSVGAAAEIVEEAAGMFNMQTD